MSSRFETALEENEGVKGGHSELVAFRPQAGMKLNPEGTVDKKRCTS